MAVPLSPNVAKAIERLFPDENKEEVARLLINECADDLPGYYNGYKNKDAYELEFIRFQVLMMSGGNIEELYKAVKLANEDFRDVLSNNDVYKYKKDLLGDDLEYNIHSESDRYSKTTSNIIAVVSFLSTFFIKYNEASAFEYLWVIYAVLFVCMAYICILFVMDRNFRKYCRIRDIFLPSQLVIICFVLFAFLGFIAAIVIKIAIQNIM